MGGIGSADMTHVQVIDGADTTLNALEKLEVDKKSRPKKPVFIQKVTIHANPIADADGGD